MKIKSKNGVDIDDISDWGANLVGKRHPGEMIQEEVSLEEGYFKMIGEPKPVLNEFGVAKKDIDGTEWFEVELEETGIALRSFD